jgi:hypothetical protein
MILAKCCHDLDILVWNLRQPVRRLSSTGSLMYYRPESVGPEIPARCTENCPIEATCPFSALGIYVDYERTWPGRAAKYSQVNLDPDRPNEWPFNVITPDVSRSGRLAAIQNGPYGRCVFRCDNDVVDHQTVMMEMEHGASVTMMMHGHSNVEHRSMRYDGTKGTLRAVALEPGVIQVNVHGGKTEEYRIDSSAGHGGGDEGIMQDFLRVVRGEIAPLTTARVSLGSHLLAFAAEDARVEHSVLEMDDYRARAEQLAR